MHNTGTPTRHDAIARSPEQTKKAAPHLCLCATIGGGFCEKCYNPVDTVNGRYTCHNCGRPDR